MVTEVVAGKANCLRCAHYFITYDTHFPYGCRALNFKSRRPPCHEVEEASGMACQTFRLKPGVAQNVTAQKVPG